MAKLNNDEAIEKYFKLSTNINTTNLVLFNPEGKLMKY